MSIPPSSNRTLSLFGSLLALILLVLYTLIVGYMISKVMTHGSSDTPFTGFKYGLIYIVTTVGGLISALVIGKLAITDPTEVPVMMKMNVAGQPEMDRWATILSYVYLGTWVLVGLSCLVVGVIFYPDTSRTVSDIGTTWFGLAIAASYSFFGIRPTGGNGG